MSLPENNPPSLPARQVTHGEALYLNPSWADRLRPLGIDTNLKWMTVTSDDLASTSLISLKNYRLPLPGHTLYFKRYDYVKPLWKHWLRPTKAIVEAWGITRLRQIGLPVPELLACGEYRRWGLVRSTFICTLGVDNMMQLDKYLARHYLTMPLQQQQRVRQHLRDEFIPMLIQAHDAGFYHRDLKLRNILINPDTLELLWIDCPRAQQGKANDSRHVLADLHAICLTTAHIFSRSQHWQFMLRYTKQDRMRARYLTEHLQQLLRKRPPRPFEEFIKIAIPDAYEAQI